MIRRDAQSFTELRNLVIIFAHFIDLLFILHTRMLWDFFRSVVCNIANYYLRCCYT